MKKTSIIVAFVFAIGFVSCTKEQISVDSQNLITCLQEPPIRCATIRCSPDGKPVCGCNKVTYSSICEAQCAGVTSYTMGACK